MCLVIMLAIGMPSAISADDHRARINYTLHCQGCHLADATGLQDEVPRMKDFVGYFLHSKEGREFVIRVPGVATSSLSDDELTELMNWLLATFSKEQLPESFEPYSVAEVSALRIDLKPGPGTARLNILQDIARDLPSLDSELKRQDGR
jgi:hypothetical protein